MPSIVVKVARDEDLYMYWSTVVESPFFVGGEMDLRHYLMTDGGESRDEATQRIERAKLNGTSARYGDPPIYGWDSEGLIYKQLGWLTRDAFSQFAHAFLDEEDETVYVQPFIHPYGDEVYV